jgi:hypothetical protein
MRKEIMNALEILKRDHDAVRKLFAEYDTSGDGAPPGSRRLPSGCSGNSRSTRESRSRSFILHSMPRQIATAEKKLGSELDELGRELEEEKASAAQ